MSKKQIEKFIMFYEITKNMLKNFSKERIQW